MYPLQSSVVMLLKAAISNINALNQCCRILLQEMPLLLQRILLKDYSLDYMMGDNGGLHQFDE